MFFRIYKAKGSGKMIEKLYINQFKKSFITQGFEEYLIITKNDCYQISEEIKFLINILPKKDSYQNYIKSMRDKGINDPEKIFEYLSNNDIIKPDIKKNTFSKITHTVKQIFHINLIIFSGNILNKFFNFISPKSSVSKKILIAEKEHIKANLCSKKISVIFWVQLSLILVTLVSCIFLLIFPLSFTVSTINSNYATYFYTLLIFIGCLIHETGHSYFCWYCGIGARPIGFTINIIFPVLFTNVSGIEEVPINKRLIIDMAGLAFQSFFMVFLIVLFISTKNILFYLTVKTLLYLMVFNFHPFIQTDGYWFFNDLLSKYSEKKHYKIFQKIYNFLKNLFFLYICYKIFNLGVSLYYFFADFFKDPSINYQLIRNIIYCYLVFTFVYLIFRKIKNIAVNMIRYFKKFSHRPQ